MLIIESSIIFLFRPFELLSISRNSAPSFFTKDMFRIFGARSRKQVVLLWIVEPSVGSGKYFTQSFFCENAVEEMIVKRISRYFIVVFYVRKATKINIPVLACANKPVFS